MFTKEIRIGLYSTLTINCSSCSVLTEIPTGKIHAENNNIKGYSDETTRAVLGAVHAGSGYTGLNKILSCLNIPTLSQRLYKIYENEVGMAMEEVAKNSCKKAAVQERKLVMLKLNELCETLPNDIVQEIYPYRNILNAEGVTVSSISEDNNTSNFDTALGEIVNIIVSYDMGWSRRGNGRSYDSLNGYASIIGFLSGKILDYTTRNRKCKKCDIGQKRGDHDCRRNFQGSAKAVEADAGVESINNSKILQEVGLKVRAVIGDEDSSTMAAIRKGNTNKIFKLSDRNHITKSFGKEL